jgi:hypothetical protein
MLAQQNPASFPTLTCSICGETTLSRFPGVTERTRYTCTRCCDRITVERGNLEPEANPFVPIEDPEVRQFARHHEVYGDARAGVDDPS